MTNRKPSAATRSTTALVQVDAGFVDLAAQVAPLVRRQAAAGAASIVALGLLLLLLLLLLILLLGAALFFIGAHLGVALAAVLLGQRKPFAPALLMLLLLKIVAAVAAVLLTERGAGAKNQSARQRTAKSDARNAHCLRCCLVVGERAIHWSSSSAMPI
jgi:hypothetical protein